MTVLHLAPGYTTSIRLPEEISSVVVGNPASFKAEHSESEAKLVFFKPTTSQRSESNALITTKSGQEISLHLVSVGKGADNARVDFHHYEMHYHQERNHQGKDNLLLFPLPLQPLRRKQGKLRCRERLGGLLKYYEREVA